eukprot:scaffold61414_cov25-Tisochrysis_lutea.AAC.8
MAAVDARSGSPFAVLRAALSSNRRALQGLSVSAVYSTSHIVEPPPASSKPSSSFSSLAAAEAAAASAAIESTRLRELVAELRARL